MLICGLELGVQDDGLYAHARLRGDIFAKHVSGHECSNNVIDCYYHVLYGLGLDNMYITLINIILSINIITNNYFCLFSLTAALPKGPNPGNINSRHNCTLFSNLLS